MSNPYHDAETGKCRDMLDDLSLYIDGEASNALCQEIERHMEGCENCRIVVDTLSKTVKLYQEHGRKPMPGDARKRLYAALDLSRYLSGEEK